MTQSASPVPWPDAVRQQAFGRWLAGIAADHGLLPDSVCLASADASFRRYLRVRSVSGHSLIIMDAPPRKEDCRPFVKVAALMKNAGLLVPEVL
ncbi:MAG: aminoglycoside phosphotransferase, partial [Gammaproteobacteria bacterium]